MDEQSCAIRINVAPLVRSFRLFKCTGIAMDAPRMPSVSSLTSEIDRRASQAEAKVIAWRRDIHQHPELGNREFRTAGIVAEHLKNMGLEVTTGVAYTGVVALLRGGQPGPVVALRADMDALPVSEEVDLPFASKARAIWEGEEVGVMHACGHDCHVAILMGVAEVLAGLREQVPGSVKFIFQPAEEGPPDGEEGGAQLMVSQGVLENPRPAAIFGLHVTSIVATGQIGYRPGPAMASADQFKIVVHGRQTHGGMPWRGVDPIVASAQVVLGLQTIISRQSDVTREPAVLTVGTIRGGVRENIIPDNVEMRGTVRTFDESMRVDIHERLKDTAESIAKASRAHAEVCIHRGYDVTVNDRALTERMVPTLQRVAGQQHAFVMHKIAGAEDFSVYQKEIPGLFFFLGVTPKGADPGSAAPNHSPRFYVDESGLLLGVRALAHLAADFLQAEGAKA